MRENGGCVDEAVCTGRMRHANRIKSEPLIEFLQDLNQWEDLRAST